MTPATGVSASVRAGVSTVFSGASRAPSRELTRTMLAGAAAAPPRASGHGKRTDECLAVRGEHDLGREDVKLLASKGADLNARNAKGLTPLAVASGRAGRKSMVDLLRSLGASE